MLDCVVNGVVYVRLCSVLNSVLDCVMCKTV